MSSKNFDVLVLHDGINNQKLDTTLNSIDKSLCHILLKVPQPSKFIDYKGLDNDSITLINEVDNSPGEAINIMLNYLKNNYFQILPSGDTLSVNYHKSISDKLAEKQHDLIISSSVIMSSAYKGTYMSENNIMRSFATNFPKIHTSSLLFNRKIAMNNNIKFSYKYNYADDIDFILKFISKSNKNILYVNNVYSKADIAGRSSKNAFSALLECYEIYKLNGLINFNTMRYFIIKLFKIFLQK